MDEEQLSEQAKSLRKDALPLGKDKGMFLDGPRRQDRATAKNKSLAVDKRMMVKKESLNDDQTRVMWSWLLAHVQYPYLNGDETKCLSQMIGAEESQIKNWLSRKRINDLKEVFDAPPKKAKTKIGRKEARPFELTWKALGKLQAKDLKEAQLKFDPWEPELEAQFQRKLKKGTPMAVRTEKNRILWSWTLYHLECPYVTNEEAEALASLTDSTPANVKNWLSKTRCQRLETDTKDGKKCFSLSSERLNDFGAEDLEGAKKVCVPYKELHKQMQLHMEKFTEGRQSDDRKKETLAQESLEHAY